MRAIDTNVVVRLLTADHAEQALAARQVFETGDIYIGVTVLLEAEWVLRAGYGFQPDQIVAALRALAGLPGVTVEDPALVAIALDWLSQGLDFADALHLARSRQCSDFVTFDQKFARRAKTLPTIPVVVP
ncbi:type II toxin-antitoxin system VapC family toxin [Novosphingobium sp.]|uniref:type II toxin-antitoxin system VapC family toxin n=1 Tax=Novosphingobium sp. TaxID=1874826 RepID=UPI00333FC202